MRLLIASDLHASEGTWRKLINAVTHGIWPADAILVAGDLAGKGIIPIVSNGDGWTATVRGQERVARSEAELEILEREVADLGLYGERMTPDELAALDDDPDILGRRFRDAIVGRVESWLALADERLAGTGVPLYLIPGNDDPYELDDLLAASDAVTYCNQKIVRLPDGRELLGLADANRTPWHTPREHDESELYEILDDLCVALEDPASATFMLHVPPYDSTIDTAPLLDESLRPTISAGDVLRGPCGSTAVREILLKYKPVLSVHGHIHESPGHVRLGDTLCVNPGSESNAGVLRACIVDLRNGKAKATRVEG